MKTETTTNETEIDLTKMVACVGVCEDGICNELNGLSKNSLEFLRGTDENGYTIGELIPIKIDDVGEVVTFEQGREMILEYAADYGLDEEYTEVLKILLNKLKQKAEGKNVKWVCWSIEYDCSLGFVE